MRPLRAADLTARPMAEDHETRRLGWFARQQVRLIGLIRGARSEEQSIGNGQRRAEAKARRLEPELETLQPARTGARRVSSTSTGWSRR